MARVNYNKRFKAISRFVSFSYKERFLNSRGLTRKQKLKITKYFNEVAALKNRPHKVYATKSKIRLAKAQEFAGQSKKKFPLFKVAFVPTGNTKVQIKFKKGKIYVLEQHITTTEILFDQSKLLENPKDHVTQKLEGVKARGFNIMAGRYEIPIGYNKDSLIREVGRLVTDSRYAKTVVIQGKERKNYHYAGDWLLGVRAHTFKKQASFTKYIGAKKKAIEEQKRKRRALRRKKK